VQLGKIPSAPSAASASSGTMGPGQHKLRRHRLRRQRSTRFAGIDGNVLAWARVRPDADDADGADANAAFLSSPPIAIYWKACQQSFRLDEEQSGTYMFPYARRAVAMIDVLLASSVQAWATSEVSEMEGSGCGSRLGSNNPRPAEPPSSVPVPVAGRCPRK
jgi:hypothetical protein